MCSLVFARFTNIFIFTLFLSLHVKDTLITFNYAYSSRSDSPVNYQLRMEPEMWRYWRRSSSEPPTSCNSSNNQADDERAASDDDEEELLRIATPVDLPVRRLIFIIMVIAVLALGAAIVSLLTFHEAFSLFLSRIFQ
jgi:hypothetical protein